MKKLNELTILSFSLPEVYEEPISPLLDEWDHIGWVIEQLPDSSILSFKVFFNFPPDVSALSVELKKWCGQLMNMGFEQCEPQIAAATMQEEDWKIYWRRNFISFPLGKTLFIKPVWEPEPSTAQEKCVVTIDPGMAFGTGLHPTTRYCLEILDQYAGRYKNVVDMGCGSGILSIAAVKLGAQHVDGYDNDPVAVDCAQNMSLLNATSTRINFFCVDLSTFISTRTYDMVLVNIYAEVLIANAEKIAALVAPSGMLALTGILNQKLPSVRSAFQGLGLSEQSHKFEAEWSGILFA